jgi:hypothetical protein
LGIAIDAIGVSQTDAVSSLSVTSLSMNAAAARGSFNASVTAYDAFEGSALEQANDTSFGANSIRLLQIANATGTRLYQATAANIGAIFSHSTNYSAAQQQVVENYLSSPSGFNVIVPQNGHEPGWSTPTYSTTPDYTGLVAFTADDSQIAYLTSVGLKGGQSGPTAPDPIAQAEQS